MLFSRRNRSTALLSVALLCFAGVTSRAQPVAQQVVLHGTLLDQKHSAINNAQVVLQNRNSHVQQSSISDQHGEFSIQIAPGPYKLTAIADGFAVHIENINVEPINTAPLEIVLEVAETSASVTITDA